MLLRCPKCDQEYAAGVLHCVGCDVAIVEVAPAGEMVVLLAAPPGFALLEARSILDGNGVQTLIESAETSALFGGAVDNALGGRGQTLLVPSTQLDRAKALLCEHQIQCEVPQDAVDRVIKRLVVPALAGAAFEPERFLHLLADQTMDFRSAVLARTLTLAGGRDFVVRLLVRALREETVGEDVRRDLARALSESGAGNALAMVASTMSASPEPGQRLRFAKTLGRFKDRATATLLVQLLDDPEAEVRDEALDSLFFRAGGETFDFDPGAEHWDRDAALKRWREWSESLRD